MLRGFLGWSEDLGARCLLERFVLRPTEQGKRATTAWEMLICTSICGGFLLKELSYHRAPNYGPEGRINA